MALRAFSLRAQSRWSRSLKVCVASVEHPSRRQANVGRTPCAQGGHGLVAAVISFTACGISYTSCEDKSGRATQLVRAHYLRPDADEVSLLEACVGKDPMVQISWGEKLPQNPLGIQVLITRLPSAEEIDALSPALQAVVIPFAGPTETTKALLKERPKLTLHNCHFNASSTAELAVALLMSAAKRVTHFDAKLRREILDDVAWSAGFGDESFNTPTLAGRTALVLGAGAVGAKVSAVLCALGMDVHVIRRRLNDESALAPQGVVVHSVSDLHKLLSQAFVLMICLPGTPATAGMIGKAELDLMPKGALLVNVGRGSVVDEAALFESLQSGHLAAAGMDVWYNYPMLPGQAMNIGSEVNLGPSSKPFHELHNVVMSPHRGQASDTKAQDRVMELMQMLSELAKTGTLPNRFDLDAGY